MHIRRSTEDAYILVQFDIANNVTKYFIDVRTDMLEVQFFTLN